MNQTKDKIANSFDINWLSELTDKSTFETYANNNNLTKTGRELFYEIDNEAMSGVKNLNLTSASNALEIINALVVCYKSNKATFFKLVNSENKMPIQNGRVFIQGKLVNLVLEYFHGFTLKKFYSMKDLVFDEQNVILNEAIDFEEGGNIKTKQGKTIRAELVETNLYERDKKQIDKTMEFLQNAKQNKNSVQIAIG